VSKALETEGSKPTGRNNLVNAIASSHSQPKGVWEGRADHGEGKRQHSGPERMLDLPRVSGGTSAQSNAEQERLWFT